jgi:hypothetical protein
MLILIKFVLFNKSEKIKIILYNLKWKFSLKKSRC